MLRAILFFTVTVFYLWLVDLRILAVRVFAHRFTEEFMNRNVQIWSKTVCTLISLFLGFGIKERTPASFYESLPEQFIFVSNHQSLIDILVVFVFFPHHKMRFVAKQELGNGFPGASQVLRYQHHALISRKGNTRDTVAEMHRLGKRSRKLGYCPVLFPEGTRSRDGELGTFHPAGLRMILDQVGLPILVAAIDGGSRMSTLKHFIQTRSGLMQMKLLGVLPPPEGKDGVRQSLETAKKMISQTLAEWRSGKTG